jgi:hypothetical protein
VAERCDELEADLDSLHVQRIDLMCYRNVGIEDKPMKPAVKLENRHANLEFWLILTPFFGFPIFDKNCADRFLN